MPEIISLGDAKARGLKHYFTGKACKRGHVTKRLVNNASCVKCQRMHEGKYRKNNPEKWKAYNTKRRREQPEKCREQQRKSYRKNLEKSRARCRKWQRENHKRVMEYKSKRDRKKTDLIAVLRAEMPELLKEFGL